MALRLRVLPLIRLLCIVGLTFVTSQVLYNTHKWHLMGLSQQTAQGSREFPTEDMMRGIVEQWIRDKLQDKHEQSLDDKVNSISEAQQDKQLNGTDSIYGGKIATTKDVPFVSVKEASCSSLIDGSANESAKDAARGVSSSWKSLSAEELIHRTRNCDSFIKTRGYTTKPISLEEANFPLAVSILMYKEPGRTERLLRAVYRPQNFYCLHVDIKSEPEVFKAVESLASCFPNVFMSSRRVSVQWGMYSILEPHYVCMRDLWKHRQWKYYTHFTGQEFPLKTNLEMVKILTIYNGANDVEGFPYDNLDKGNQARLTKTASGQPKTPFPHALRFFKGPIHASLSRAFVGYLLHDKIAEELRAWSEDLNFPEEMVFPTLQHNPQLGAPGAYTGSVHAEGMFITRHTNWADQGKPCFGKYVRTVCIFGIGDLPYLAHSPQLAANKFFSDVESLAYDCLEELHFNKTREDLTDGKFFNATYYQSLPFVKYALRNVTQTYG